MRTEYPDLFEKFDCGDGLMRYTDNGYTYFQQGGKDMKWCRRCGELDFEGKMSWDDLCTNCQEHDRTCWHCGDVFAEELAKDDEGHRICLDCIAINEALDVQQMVRKLYDMSNVMEEMVRGLKVMSETCDWDSYLYNAHEDLNKIHSRLLGFMDELKEAV